jgi:hypothetical protein
MPLRSSTSDWVSSPSNAQVLVKRSGLEAETRTCKPYCAMNDLAEMLDYNAALLGEAAGAEIPGFHY